MPRSNKERTEQTRADLIAAGRQLFVEKGYADTATPDIVAAAGVTRGALYHHFEDKRALFAAVLANEAQAVAAEIEAATPAQMSPREALLRGGDAYLAAMKTPGRTRLLLLDGPAVLGRDAVDVIDRQGPAGSLTEGLAFAVQQGAMSRDLALAAVAALLSAAFDRAAIAIAAGEEPAQYQAAIAALIDGLLV